MSMEQSFISLRRGSVWVHGGAPKMARTPLLLSLERCSFDLTNPRADFFLFLLLPSSSSSFFFFFFFFFCRHGGARPRPPPPWIRYWNHSIWIVIRWSILPCNENRSAANCTCGNMSLETRLRNYTCGYRSPASKTILKTIDGGSAARLTVRLTV